LVLNFWKGIICAFIKISFGTCPVISEFMCSPRDAKPLSTGLVSGVVSENSIGNLISHREKFVRARKAGGGV
jgi:hypothetical protein